MKIDTIIKNNIKIAIERSNDILIKDVQSALDFIAIVIVIFLIIINSFTVYKFLFNAIFSNRDDFNEAVRYSFTPNIISLFRGEYWKDRVGEFKLGMFIILCIMATAVEYWIVISIIR